MADLPPPAAAPRFAPWLHRFAILVAAYTLVVISAGGIITTIGAGLAVPDWPTSYGTWLGPDGWWRLEPVRAEHGHRLLAAALGFLILVLTFWIHAVETRRWVRHLGKFLLFGVVLQGTLGGVTVWNLLPWQVSTLHGCLAQILFCAAATLAVATSPRWIGWRDAIGGTASVDPSSRTRTLAAVLFGLVFCQLVLGALMRHLKAPTDLVTPLAFHDFPLMDGALVPELVDLPAGIHFVHRLGALTILLLTIVLFVRVRTRHAQVRALRLPATLLGTLVFVQVGLGATVIWTEKSVWITVAHVVTGASILGTVWVFHLLARRALVSATAPSRPHLEPMLSREVHA